MFRFRKSYRNVDFLIFVSFDGSLLILRTRFDLDFDLADVASLRLCWFAFLLSIATVDLDFLDFDLWLLDLPWDLNNSLSIS
jgi:hypothetical protein